MESFLIITQYRAIYKLSSYSKGLNFISGILWHCCSISFQIILSNQQFFQLFMNIFIFLFLGQTTKEKQQNCICLVLIVVITHECHLLVSLANFWHVDSIF